MVPYRFLNLSGAWKKKKITKSLSWQEAEWCVFSERCIQNDTWFFWPVDVRCIVLSSHLEFNRAKQSEVVQIRWPCRAVYALEYTLSSQVGFQQSNSFSLHFCCFYPSDKRAQMRIVDWLRNPLSALLAQLAITHLPLLMVNRSPFLPTSLPCFQTL